MMLNWMEAGRFSVDGVNFRAVDLLNAPKMRSSVEEFIFFKPPWMVQRYANLVRDLRPKNIFELGIWQGGSCVFFQRLAQADKLVTIDISETRIAAVDGYVERYGLQSVLRPYYGVNQADVPRLRGLLAEEFAGAQLDLVIDDASHFLDETRISFNTIFPHLRPGAAYVIEDWPWAHVGIDDFPDDATGFFPDREPMTKLIFQILLACASTRELISKVEIDRNSATVWRGSAPIEDVAGFDVARLCTARGRALIV